jgi:hypothetical protein
LSRGSFFNGLVKAPDIVTMLHAKAALTFLHAPGYGMARVHKTGGAHDRARKVFPSGLYYREQNVH